MNVEDRLTRARIQIQRRNSFFAYLSLYLKFKESKELPDYAGAGVNSKGDFFYKKEFIEKLNDEELVGVIIHEILHLSLLHLLRGQERDAFKFNVACDIVVNQIISDNNFKLPNGCLMPYGNTIMVGLQEIKDTNKKIAEEIYDEIKSEKGESDGDGRFDEHIRGNLTDAEKRQAEKEWLDKTEQALAVSKMKGDLPAGIERIVGRLHEEKIKWKALLYQYITKELPYDYSWGRPSKKSVSIGTYLPDVIKEKIEITIGIDVSGSIGQQELNDFLSEIIGIAKAFQERITFRLLTHEVDVVDDWEVRNGSIEKIKQLEIKGGGGTSHINIFNYIKEKIKDCKCAIFLTDACSDIEEINFNDYNFEKIFVVSAGGKELNLNGGKVINLKD